MPTERREASATTSSAGKPRSSRMLSISRPDIARGTDDCDLETHDLVSCPSPLAFAGETPPASRLSLPGPDPGEGEQAKGDQTVVVVVLAVDLVEQPRGDRPFGPSMTIADQALAPLRIASLRDAVGFYPDPPGSQSPRLQAQRGSTRCGRFIGLP